MGKTAKKKARVIIVDDHALVRHGLSELINRDPDLEVIAEAESTAEAFQTIRKLQPELAIVDLCLDGSMSGLELIKDIRTQCPDTRILVLSMREEAVFAQRSLRAGASGYVRKEEAVDTVLDAIHAVLQGQVWLSPRMSRNLLQELVGHRNKPATFPIDTLSDRELEVLSLIGQGLGTSEIARKLSLSVKTIETYRSHLKEKLALPDAAALLKFAIEWTQSTMPT